MLNLKFSDLLNESATYDKLGVGTISNKENANAKQLRWEMDREARFRKGGSFKRSSRRNGGGGGGHRSDSGSKKKPVVSKNKGSKKPNGSKPGKNKNNKKPAKSGSKKSKRK